MAAQRQNKAVRVLDLLRQANVYKRELNKGIALCSEYFSYEVPCRMDMVEAKLDEVGNLPLEVVESAKMIAENLDNLGLLMSHHAATTAALCLLMAVKYCPSLDLLEKANMIERVTKRLSVTKTTLNSAFEAVRKHRDSVLPQYLLPKRQRVYV